jgi:hypothetical protein
LKDTTGLQQFIYHISNVIIINKIMRSHISSEDIKILSQTTKKKAWQKRKLFPLRELTEPFKIYAVEDKLISS